MISAFQKKKLNHLFSVYDVDNDGRITQTDFDMLLESLAKITNAAKDSETYKALAEYFQVNWETLKQLADENNDGTVSAEEWVIYAERMLATDEGFQAMVGSVADTIFDMFDLNKDGKLSASEYTHFCEAYHLSGFDAPTQFAKFMNNEPEITKEAMAKLINDFFLSDDTNSPGNEVFGPLA